MIRRYNLEDIKQIVDIEMATLNTTLGEEMFINNYQNPFSYCFVFEEVDIKGYISVFFDQENLEILNFCVQKQYQGQGVGKTLLAYILDYFKTEGAKSAVLEVRESNLRAINLYENFRFKKIGIRKAYYSNSENALVMQKLF